MHCCSSQYASNASSSDAQPTSQTSTSSSSAESSLSVVEESSLSEDFEPLLLEALATDQAAAVSTFATTLVDALAFLLRRERDLFGVFLFVASAESA